MMNGPTLALEASTGVGSVAIIDGNKVVAERTVPMRGQTGERLLPAVIECLDEVAMSREEIRRIVCGAGPGSFTSLRIAGSLAKGMAMALDVPLYAVASHLLIVAGDAEPPRPGRYLVVIDALRGESFAAEVDVDDRSVVTLREAPALMRNSEIPSRADTLDATLLAADGERPRHPHARGVLHLLAHLNHDGSVNLDSWEPDYGRPAEAQARWELSHGRPLR